MTSDVFRGENLDNSLLIGFYGGGNLGDELLLEILMNLFKERGYKKIDFYYSNPSFYPLFHHDFGFTLVDARSKRKLFSSLLKAKNVVVGGGGLWGMDFNTNVLLFSVVLFVARFLLRKNVYLLGVGYYNSTSRLGRIGGLLAGLSSKWIVVRDQESKENFKFFPSKTFLQKDLSFLLPELDLHDYKQEAEKLDEVFGEGELVLISVRRFQKKYENNYSQIVLETVKNNPGIKFAVAMCEPREMDPDNFAQLSALDYDNVRFLEFRYNPIALYLFLKAHNKKIIAIVPQFHGIILAHLAGVRFLPFFYDNKVSQLLKSIGVHGGKPIAAISLGDIETFLRAA